MCLFNLLPQQRLIDWNLKPQHRLLSSATLLTGNKSTLAAKTFFLYIIPSLNLKVLQNILPKIL